MRNYIRKIASAIPNSEGKYSLDYLLRKFTEGVEYDSQKSHYWWRTIFSDAEKEKLFDVSPRCVPMDSFESYKAYYEEAPRSMSFSDKSLYADLFMFCVENANMMTDNLSMAFSLEARPPFLTKRFVEFAFNVPYRFKLRDNITKYCLRKAYSKEMPRYITWARKSGLVSPVSNLIRGQLREIVCDAFADAGRYPFFKKTYLQRLLDDHLSGKRDYGLHIYSLFCFMRWHNIFVR
jgi:asparagine synthase (glutamine-hydrolysing)